MREYRASMRWRDWEDTFDGILREGGWEWWRDRVVKATAVRTLLAPFQLPKPVIDQLIGMIQRSGRIPGLPDRTIAKTFPEHQRVPAPLSDLLKLDIAENIMYQHREVTVFGFVELKTGRGKVTEEQRRWLDFADKCPGMFGLVARPEDMDNLRRVLC